MTRRNTRTILPFVIALIAVLFSLFIIQSCSKTSERRAITEEASMQERRKKPTPPPPVYFYFTNCSNPVFSSNFVAGVPASATVTLNYINSPGGPYPAFTSAVVNGLTISAPAGTFTSGSGSIVFTVSGTPVTPSVVNIPVSAGSSLPCNLPVTVLNPPTSGPCSEPGAAIGSTGCVTFMYRGQQVTYKTVRAGDGKVWLQQNLGSPQIALHSKDSASYGHYFQWGRWDDGHQLKNSSSVTGGPSLQNPSHIPGGNPNLIKGSMAATAWWGTGGAITDTWSGTNATATNGKDPCVAIGPGWHLPSATEWTNVMNAEAINDEPSAFESTLKLPLSGYKRSADAFVTAAFTTNFGYYWSNTAAGNTAAQNPTASNTSAKAFNIDTYTANVSTSERGYGFSCRCVKN